MTDLDRLETFFVRLADGAPPDAAERVADQVAVLGGLVLLATERGSLVVALPREAKEAIGANTHVALIGGVTVSKDGAAPGALQRRFALNAARQIAGDGRLTALGSATAHTDEAEQIGRIAVHPLRHNAERSPQ